MKSDSSLSYIVRIIFTLVVFLAWSFLPFIYLFILAILGTILFDFYFEGLFFVFLAELILGIPENYLLGLPLPFLGTITILILMLLSDFFKTKLLMYN